MKFFITVALLFVLPAITLQMRIPNRQLRSTNDFMNLVNRQSTAPTCRLAGLCCFIETAAGTALTVFAGLPLGFIKALISIPRAILSFIIKLGGNLTSGLSGGLSTTLKTLSSLGGVLGGSIGGNGGTPGGISSGRGLSGDIRQLSGSGNGGFNLGGSLNGGLFGNGGLFRNGGLFGNGSFNGSVNGGVGANGGRKYGGNGGGKFGVNGGINLGVNGGGGLGGTGSLGGSGGGSINGSGSVGGNGGGSLFGNLFGNVADEILRLLGISLSDDFRASLFGHNVHLYFNTSQLENN